jgi:hypothetical protein
MRCWLDDMTDKSAALGYSCLTDKMGKSAECGFALSY